MDITRQQGGIQCTKHEGNECIYLKANEVTDNEAVFLCEVCVNQDEDFKSSHFVRIKEILEKKYVYKWPPLHSQKVHQQIQEQFQNPFDTNDFLTNKISVFFDELKTELNMKIESCKKEVLKMVSEENQGEEILKSLYDGTSKLEELRNILLKSFGNYQEGEESYKEFLKKISEKKSENQQKFQNFINVCEEQKSVLEKLKNIKEECLKQIDQSNKLIDQSFYRSRSEVNLLTYLSFTVSRCCYQNEEILQEVNERTGALKIYIDSDVSGYGTKCYSNCILDKKRRYRINVEATYRSSGQLYQRFGIGLTRDEFKDQEDLYKDNLFCHFNMSTSSLSLTELSSNVTTIVSGNLQSVQKPSQLKLIFEIDFPSITFKVTNAESNFVIAVNDRFKPNLQDYQNLRLYLFLDSFSEANITSFVEF